ncbi:hypothetical protein ScPMuIL_010719 [Solemya velum]
MSDVSILERFISSPLREDDIPGELLKHCFKDSSPKLNEFLGHCVWEGTLKDCSEIFNETVTEYGLCFTFNGDATQRANTGSTGSTSGLHVLVNIQQDKYFFSKTLEAGVKSLLSGEAKSVLQGLSVTSGNYKVACDLLESRFGRKERIIFAHIQKLLNIFVLPSGKGIRVAALWKLFDELQTHVRSFETLRAGGGEYGLFLTSVILSRLPQDIRMEWARDGESRKNFVDGAVKFQNRIPPVNNSHFQTSQKLDSSEHRTSNVNSEVPHVVSCSTTKRCIVLQTVHVCDGEKDTAFDSDILHKFGDLDSIGITPHTTNAFSSDSVLKNFNDSVQYKNGRAVEELDENLNVDDWLSGADTEVECCHLFRDANAIMLQASMSLAKGASNRHVVSHMFCKEFQMLFSCSDLVKILGLKWLPQMDCFSFGGFDIPVDLVTTKRVVLSFFFLTRLFDPLGFLTPFVMVAKLLVQQIWQLGLEWDIEVPGDIHVQFVDWIKGLKVIREWNIPRCYFMSGWCNLDKLELHIFADVSMKGYGAVARSPFSDGSYEVSFVTAKARVAPLKKVILPRLELLGALLAARLFDFVSKALRLSDIVYKCWTDSQIVLAWIRNDASRWKQFVCDRVVEIQQLTTFSLVSLPRWRNPADVLFRGAYAEKLCTSKLWLKRPRFLSQSVQECASFDNEDWPERESHVTASVGTSIDSPVFYMTRWNTFTKVIRIVALVMRFVSNLKFRGHLRQTGELAFQELSRAKTNLSHHDQQLSFSMVMSVVQQVVRAVHLELTDAMSMQDVMLTFRRFSARRGLPSVLYADNAKIFHGGVIVLHEPQENPFPASRGISVGPGMASSIAIRKESTKALPSPYKGSGSEFCLYTHGTNFVNPLERYEQYSRMACLSECDINEFVATCGCRFFLDPGNEDLCSLDQSQYCYIPKQRSALNSREYRKNCTCRNPCQETKYVTTASYSQFGSNFINDVLRQKDILPDEGYVRNNIIGVRIYYDSLLETETVQFPELTMEGILGNFGGLMGLFLGASLLSLSEILELVFLLIYQRFRGSKEDHNQDHNDEELTGTLETRLY